MRKANLQVAALLLLTSVTFTSFRQLQAQNLTLQVGDVAPDFKLRYFDGHDLKDVSLSEYRGKKMVVLAFYVFAFTGGCFAQMKHFQQNLSAIEATDTQLLGVSMDSPFVNKAFADQIGVTFPLLSDWGGEVTHRYGVFVDGYKASRRVNFLIGKDGRILEEQVDREAIDPAKIVAACERPPKLPDMYSRADTSLETDSPSVAATSNSLPASEAADVVGGIAESVEQVAGTWADQCNAVNRAVHVESKGPMNGAGDCPNQVDAWFTNTSGAKVDCKVIFHRSGIWDTTSGLDFSLSPGEKVGGFLSPGGIWTCRADSGSIQYVCFPHSEGFNACLGSVRWGSSPPQSGAGVSQRNNNATLQQQVKKSTTPPCSSPPCTAR